MPKCRNVIEINEDVDYALDESMDDYCTNEDCNHPRCYHCHNLDPNLRRIYGRGDESDSNSSCDNEADQDGKSDDDDDSRHNTDNDSGEAESKQQGKASEVAGKSGAYNENSKNERLEPANHLRHDNRGSNGKDSPSPSTSASSHSSTGSSPNSSLHDSLIEGSINSEDAASDGEAFDIDDDIMEMYGDMLASLGLAELF